MCFYYHNCLTISYIYVFCSLYLRGKKYSETRIKARMFPLINLSCLIIFLNILNVFNIWNILTDMIHISVMGLILFRSPLPCTDLFCTIPKHMEPSFWPKTVACRWNPHWQQWCCWTWRKIIFQVPGPLKAIFLVYA